MRIKESSVKDFLAGHSIQKSIVGGTAMEGRLRDSQGGVKALPAIPLTPLQDTNPLSATYGDFFYMAGYDPLP